MPEDTLDPRAGRLEDWAAEARAEEAAAERSRRHWLAQQAAEEAGFLSVLSDLAERRELVVVTTQSGTVRPGTITGVGADFVAVSDATRRLTLVAIHAVAGVRTISATERRAMAALPPASVPPAVSAPNLGEVLASAAHDRPRVSLHSGQMVVSGELRAAGAEVVTVATAGLPEGFAYVRLASLSEVSFFGSAG